MTLARAGAYKGFRLPAEERIQSVVELRGVSKYFGARAAVVDLDLRIPAGLCFAMLGPNGAGKTTGLRMIYGATRPTAGSVSVFGLDVARSSRAVRARLGVTLQDNVLIEELSPVDNLRIFGRFHRLTGPQLDARIDELLDWLDLRAYADVPVAELSGGFHRRLAIALSLLNRPELLLLDEPTTGLDPAVRQALWSRIRELRAGGTSVVLTTHYMEEAERLCDRVAILDHGRCVCEGAPRALIAERLPSEAVEIDCPEEDESRLFPAPEAPSHRIRSGERLIVYSERAADVIDRIRRSDGGDRRPLVARPTNLEDVFLSATGTHLQGGA